MMQDRATVAATDIARLAGVGRAAVSNWRRRFDDFPSPIAGTSSSPLFSLIEVEEWLRRQGKLVEVPLEERVWQRVRADVEDIDLAKAVGRIGAILASGAMDVAMPQGLAELVAERGRAATFDFLYERYAEAHSRRVAVVSPEVADLMVALADVAGATVLDPVCGSGSLLITAAGASAARLLGQDRDEASAAIAQARLRLHEHDGTVLAGDALRQDRFDSVLADAVVCSPPFGDRNWGYEELASDMRWMYGLPPRTEPELPWVQHCLFHVRPGGHVVILMPSGAADRRSGRRIRAQLLRTGALRAVVTLPAGTAPSAVGSPHLWILRRPESSDPTPTHVLMIDVADAPWPQAHKRVVERWQAFQAATKVDGTVPVIDLLDEIVDLSPGRYASESGNTGPCFTSALDTMSVLLEDLRGIIDELRTLGAGGETVHRTTIAEQVKAGALTVLNGPRTEIGSGKIPLLTLEDIVDRQPPTGRTIPSTKMITLRPGDVVVPSGGRIFAVQVIDEGEAVLGPGLQILRADPDRLDPACLAGFIRIAALQHAQSRGQTGTSRLDSRRIELPRIALPEQRRLGIAFRRLDTFEAMLGRLTEEGSHLVNLALRGLSEGTLNA
jgi:hypothetical protein